MVRNLYEWSQWLLSQPTFNTISETIFSILISRSDVSSYATEICLHFTALTVLLTLEDSIHFFSFHIFLFQLRKFRQYRGKLGLKRQKHNCKLVHNGRGNKHEKIESTKNAEAKSKACECFVQWLIGFRVLLHHAFTHCNLKSGTLERSGQRNLSIFSTLEFPKSSNDIEQRQTFEFFDTNVRQL